MAELKKIGWKDEPSEDTPIDSGNLGGMEKNTEEFGLAIQAEILAVLEAKKSEIETKIETEILKLKEKLEGTTLYENEIGTNGNITFNKQIQEGDLIEIIYCRRRTNGTSVIKTSGKLPFSNGMEVNLDINYYSNVDNQQSISKAININTTEITVTGENNWSNVNPFNSSSTIYILKVKKYPI